MKFHSAHMTKPLFPYLVGFIRMRYQHSPLPPTVALVTADSPQQHISCALTALSALLNVQRADAGAEHVVPEGQAQIRVLPRH